MTNNFIRNSNCKKIFLYASNQLGAKIKLILLSRDFEWKIDEDIGALCSDEVYFNMENIGNFNDKMNDLHKTIAKVTNPDGEKIPECFISYCWNNSRKARNKPQNFTDTAISNTDPRDLKERIEETGIKCWLDIEQVGKVGLYQDIFKGLQKCKVFVCCISDEYAKSNNCKMEFRFATLNLQLPTIMVAVGNGFDWLKSEIKMISQSFPVFFMKSVKDDTESIKKLVKRYVESGSIDTQLINQMDNRNSKSTDGLNELVELLERKFLKYISLSSNHFQDRKFLPHLLMIDLLKKDLKNASIEGYCFYFLCEYPGGWHIPENCEKIKWIVQWDGQEAKNLLNKWSFYLSKLFNILKHTDLQLFILNTKNGEKVMNDVFKYQQQFSNLNENDNFIKSYNFMFDFVRNLAFKSQIRGFTNYLGKCSFLGKDLWLCSSHLDQSNAKIISIKNVDFGRELTIDYSKSNDESIVQTNFTDYSQTKEGGDMSVTNNRKTESENTNEEGENLRKSLNFDKLAPRSKQVDIAKTPTNENVTNAEKRNNLENSKKSRTYQVSSAEEKKTENEKVKSKMCNIS